MNTSRLSVSPSSFSILLLLALLSLSQLPVQAAEGVIRVVRGGLFQQVYTNIFGLGVTDLTNAAKFPDRPDRTNIIGAFETRTDSGDWYGERLSGYVVPPATGEYIFYLSADDQAVLYLSPSLTPTEKVLIAQETTFSSPRSWTGLGGTRTNSANISAPVHLVAGQAYYVEALHKEGMGGDSFGVAWQIPGAPVPVNGSEPIMGEFLGYALHTNYPPEVVIVSPPEGAVFAAGTNIFLRASATSVGQYMTQVRFYANTNLIGTGYGLSSDPRAFVMLWSNVPPGRYELTARATDTTGQVGTSAPVHITVTNVVSRMPVITKQPVSQRRYAGQPASFSIEASGTAPLIYSWRHNEVLIPNATSPNLSLASVQLSDSGQYAATVANTAGSATSQAATLTVVPIPTTFPPSISIPMNCGSGGYGSSNYKLADLGSDEVELHVVGVYEGIAHVNGPVNVKVKATPKPVVLALSAYQPVIWTISLDAGARLSAVYVSGPYNPQTVTGVPPEIPVYRVSFGTYAYGWEPDRNTGGGSYQTLIRNVRSITGLVESSFQGCYAGNEFEIPYTVPDNTPPSVVCEASRTVSSSSTNGVFETLRASVRDAEGDGVTVVWFVDGIAKATNNLPLGPTSSQSVSFDDWFGLGSHNVTVTATDGRSQPQSCSLVLTVLYGPQTGLVVTSGADSGPGTLRDIIAAAPAGATIHFAITGAINLTSGEILLDKPLNIEGPGAQVLSIQRAETAPAFRLFNIQARGIALSDLTLRNGFVNETDSWKFGGGILNNGALILSRCVMSDNRASAEYSRGGAICNQMGAGLLVLQCLFASNSTPAYYGEAGAIYNYGRLAITNSTFSGNSAGSWGGAVHNDMMSAGCWIDSCTFTLNRGSDGGAIFNRGAPPYNTSPVWLRNNILVGNTPDDLSHCSVVLSGGYNLIGKISDPYGSMGLPIIVGPGDLFGVTPEQVRLAPLQMNGGPTRTHALLRRSIAIDAGPESGPPALDQRGIARPYGVRLDIGAFESDVLFPDTAPEVACPEPATWRAQSNTGATGTLTASVRDVDGDPLTITWLVDGARRQTNSYPHGSVTWTNVSLTLTLPVGRHQVEVSVFDGTPPAASCSTAVEVLAGSTSWVIRKISGNAVRLTANPPPGTSAWAVEETPPQNWAILGVTNGVFDRATGKVKFGPFFDGEPRPLGYTALPPLGFVGIGLFTGMASADGKSTPVLGDDRIVIPWPHPADLNPDDWMMRLDEVTAYAAAWRTGSVWPTPPNRIPIDYVTKAASLWQNGEAYMMDPSVGGPPAWWVSRRPKVSLALKDGEPGSGTRCAPPGYVPGQPLEIAVQAAPSPNGGAFAVEESVPAGWRVASVSHGGQFDSVNSQIKWGPFFDSQARTLSYKVIPPVEAHGSVSMTGNASFEGLSVPVTGQSQLACGSTLKLMPQSGNEQWKLQLQGEIGASYVVESSTDLLNWTPVTTVTNQTGAVDVPVFTAPTERLYYRAKAIQ